MNMKPIESAHDPDLRASQPALQRAARRARELAAQTGTAIIVSHDGVIEHILPEPARAISSVQESVTTYGDKA